MCAYLCIRKRSAVLSKILNLSLVVQQPCRTGNKKQTNKKRVREKERKKERKKEYEEEHKEKNEEL